jgi:hypothetical protein
MPTAKSIWDYRLTERRKPGATIRMPEGARVLNLAMRGDVPTLWALVDPKAELVPRMFLFRGNDETVGDQEVYIGTIQEPPQWGQSTGTALHLFEVLDAPPVVHVEELDAVVAGLGAAPSATSFILGDK